MKKDLLYLGMGALALGILLALTGHATDGALGGLFFGMGGGLSGVGLSYLHRWNVLRGDQQSDYARHVRQTDIEQRDERNIMLRGRSAYITLADGSCSAVAHAMQHYPGARRISAKPVRTRSAG